MKTSIVLTTLLLSAACYVTEGKASDVDVNDQFAKLKQISLDQAQSPEAKEYFGTMAGFWQKILNESTAKCHLVAGSGVELILTINEQGVIDDVVGSPWNDRSKCFSKMLSGKTASPPPEHPFYLSTKLP